MIKEIVNETIQKTVYVTFDGTRFSDESEAKLYEGSAECIIRSKVKIVKSDEYILFNGNEECKVEIVTGEYDNVLHYVMSRYIPYDSSKKRITELFNSFGPIGELKIILFYNCEGELWDVKQFSDFIQNIYDIAEYKK